MDHLARFSELLRSPEPRLDEALALIAASGRDFVDPDQLVRRLDALAASVRAADAPALCAELFGSGGFAGDRSDYHDPRNSLLDEVLDRRRGIPITLAVIGIEVGRRCGVGLVGIGMPGHFLLRTSRPTTPVGADFFDPFDGGRALEPTGARALFDRLHAGQLGFDAAYLAPVEARTVVVRVLNNLRNAYVRAGDRRGLARVLRLQSAFEEYSVAARGDLATVLAADGRFDDAAEVHESLARDDPTSAVDHTRAATRLRARMN